MAAQINKGNVDSARDRYTDKDGLFHYVGCGLDNVYLKGGVEFEPDGSYSISNMEGLYDCLAACIAKHTGLMSGKELRFLRKHLNYSQKHLANKLSVDSQTVARWEKEEETTIEPRADKLVRIFYLVKKDGSNTLTVLGDILKNIDDIDIDVSAHRKWKFQQGETEDAWTGVAA